MVPSILVIGGAGYIGSHICKLFAQNGYCPIVYDTFATGHRSFAKFGPYVEANVLDKEKLQKALHTYAPLAVIHLAAYSNIRQSLLEKELYYQNNLQGTQTLLEALKTNPVPYLLFSSSASVYGMGSTLPLTEESKTSAYSPYAETKLLSEELIKDFCSQHATCYGILRYFNVAGADPEKEIGEAHTPETHLIPLLIQVLKKEKTAFPLLTTSHPTADGTAQRDFIHVSDLARAHIDVLQWMQTYKQNITLNLGSGKGHTLLEVIERLEKKVGCPITIEKKHPVEEPASLVADITKASSLLGWRPIHSDLDNILETALCWHLQ